MERPELENERRRLEKNKEKMSQCTPRCMLALLPVPVVRPPIPITNRVQLAAVAADLNVRLRSADMPAAMQERVIRYAKVLLDSNAHNKKFNPTHLAMCLKKGTRCVVWTGMALHSREQFRFVCDSLQRWICIFFNRQALVSSLQNGGPSSYQEVSSATQV